MADTYHLHYFPESGSSCKLAQMQTLCRQPFDLAWTGFAARVAWSKEWRRTVNPMGGIPVLLCLPRFDRDTLPMGDTGSGGDAATPSDPSGRRTWT